MFDRFIFNLTKISNASPRETRFFCNSPIFFSTYASISNVFFQRFYRFLWSLRYKIRKKGISSWFWRDNFWLNARSRNTVIRMKSYFQYSMGYLGPFQILTKGKSSKIKLRISIRHIFVIFIDCQWWNVIDVSTDLFSAHLKWIS